MLPDPCYVIFCDSSHWPNLPRGDEMAKHIFCCVKQGRILLRQARTNSAASSKDERLLCPAFAYWFSDGDYGSSKPGGRKCEFNRDQ
jgi:hypothetical protein